MKRQSLLVALLVSGIVMLAAPLTAAERQTLTGQVSDAACGAHHSEAPDPTACTRMCVGRGAKYTLVVGDKVYVLNTSDEAIRKVLDQQAGKNVTVTGEVNGVGVMVSTAVPAK